MTTALNGGAAGEAGLAFPPVNAMLKLEEPGFAGSVHIIGNRGAAGGDGLVKHLLHGLKQAVKVGAGERGGAAAGTNAGAGQRLVGVDVADAAQQASG